MYEASIVPERLPGGGGFSLKNFSLNALYTEHDLAHNFWTKTNIDLPLCRFTGLTLKLYQSEHTDYVFSYSKQLPLQSSMAMYNSLQPSIHQMNKHSIVVPSKKTKPRKKPYIKLKIKPTNQLENKWYFQKDLANTPLIMTRATALSLDSYYIPYTSLSTNITINYLNTDLIQNTYFTTTASSGYNCKGEGTNQVWLYASDSENNSNNIPLKSIIFLGNTKTNTPGRSPEQAHKQQVDDARQHLGNKANWGNPFWTDYLKGNIKVYQSKCTIATMMTNFNKIDDTTSKIQQFGFTEVQLVYQIRYNPMRDTGSKNACYFKPNYTDKNHWEPPEKQEHINQGLPLWLLLFGYPDFMKKTKELIRIDDEQTLVLQTDLTTPPKKPIVILNDSFIEGKSPFEDKPNPADHNRWYPSFQFQQIIYNIICLSGPGTPKIPKDRNIEAKIKYQFFFKWGGNLPPMSQIADPKAQINYPIPSNLQSTNSLQNPTEAPERLLYSFDQRRGELTKKALQRITKDSDFEKYFITDPAERFQVPVPRTETSEEEETTSEEEEKETDLFRLLQQQYRKQRHLRQRILTTLTKLQSLE